MAITSFQLIDNQVFIPSDISNGNIFISPDQINDIGVDRSTGIKVVIDYSELQASGNFQAVLEGKSNQGQYYVLGYQFEEFRFANFPQKRQIVMYPDLNWPDAGIDNIVFVGGTTVEQVSNQPGTLLNIWRVRVNITNTNNFTSIRMSIYGERFNQLTLPDNFKGLLFDKAGTIITDFT